LYCYRARGRWRTSAEEDLRAKLAPGGNYYQDVVEGGAWWQHCQEHIAKFKNVTAKQNKAGDVLTKRQMEAVP
jgi:hypothetical protein